jgi:A/G-specific adenine glycosylase
MSIAKDRTSNKLPRHRFTSAQKQTLRRRLLTWYGKNARDLPWRRSRDPYRVWISEVMLQQTQVATVRDYFARFVRAFPNVRRLAAADEQQVLRLWEGLGYYRRARQLHAAARQIDDEHDGKLPRTVAELQRLPGVGRYTAGAIASFAFDVRAPIVETNTIRLLSRLIAYRDDPLNAAGQQILWQTAEDILPKRNCSQFNQAVMELGSLVCTPLAPNCDECPLTRVCAARALGVQHQIPKQKTRPATIDLREVAIIVRKYGRVLVRQCGQHERWAGLWDFPRFALDAEEPLFAPDEIALKVKSLTGITCAPGPLVKTFKHGVTRYRITLDCYRAEHVSGRIRSSNRSPVRWVPLAVLADYPLSVTGRKITSLLNGSCTIDPTAGPRPRRCPPRA